MKLNLGVFDLAYTTDTGLTTGDVAEFIEAKYGLLERFAELHEQRIAHAVAERLAGMIETMTAGGPEPEFPATVDRVATAMRTFVTSLEAENAGIPGTPTQAALKGISHRFKNPRGIKVKGRRKLRRRPRRPSFRDTGQMIASYTAWLE